MKRQVELKGIGNLQRQLKRLEQESPKTIRNGLARLGVKARDDIADETGKAFEFSNSATKSFLVRSWKYKYGTESGSIFRVLIYPLEAAGEILRRHVARTTVTARDKADLVVDGKIAIPFAVPRNGRGRVAKNMSPDALLKKNARGDSRGFIVGKVLFARRRGQPTIAAYVLQDATQTEKRFDPQEIAARTVTRRAGEAFGEAIREAMRRAGMKVGR